MKKKHRDSQKRIYFEDAVYFVTCKTKDGYPYFKESIFCDLFVENLRICKKLKGFYLYGWVLLYNHFHLLVRPNDEFNVSEVMFSIKKQFSHDVNRVIGYNQKYPDMYPPKARKRLRAFGGVGANLCENITNHQICVNKLHTQFLNKYPSELFPKFQWQLSYHDHYIRNDNDFDYHMDYMIWNPDKHKMPNNWKYILTNPDYDDLVDEIGL
ncbi:transposase [Candidatus Peregrinibacteria bacterium]|nr:transposase [Candidatus Peregrinibacteria bacterium]